MLCAYGGGACGPECLFAGGLAGARDCGCWEDSNVRHV